MENAHLITSDVQQSEPVNCVTFEPVQLLSVPISATASVIQPKSNIFKFNTEEIVQAPVLTSQIPLKPDEEQLNQLASQLCATSSTDNCISSTATVLAPKTADMESGFLMFTDDNQGMTVLTDADDLTHLAPDAGDLCVPMLPDMDFSDMSLFDDIFLNSTSFNINGSNLLTEEDLLNNLSNFDSDKINMDNFDLNLESENNMKKYDTGLLSINNKEIPEIRASNFEQFALSNDPFLSFGNQNDELLISTSPNTSSSCSLTDPYSSSSNSPTGSPSSRMTQFSPKSSSGDEMSDKNLCDTTDFVEDKDLEMRAPFIPIDDDFLLNDFAYSDSNMDDLFNWISTGSNGVNNKANNGKSGFDVPYDNTGLVSKPKQSNPISMSSKNSGCLEALLQNDQLICNLKNKMYNSNQLLNRTQMALQPNVTPINTTNTLTQQQTFVPAQVHQQSSLKRKNSNILIYTTLNSGDKKFKNLVLSAESIGAAKLNDKSTVHHFVLTKNNELIPKSDFVNQINQSLKVSSKRVLPMEQDSHSLGGNSNVNFAVASDSFLMKEDLLLKKARQEPDKGYCKCYHLTFCLISLLIVILLLYSQ